MNRNFSSSRVESPASHSIFMQARAQARKGSILADVIFAGVSVLPESDAPLNQKEPSRNEEFFEETKGYQQLVTRWFRVSPLAMLEMGAHVAAMFDEPDGTRLVRAVIATLEQLGITTIEEIGQAMQARLPELFALPLAYPYDDVCILLKQYLCLASEAGETHEADRSGNSTSDDPPMVVSCERCGREWPVTIARDWLHYESFVCGLGCPACRADFRDRARHPSQEDS